MILPYPQIAIGSLLVSIENVVYFDIRFDPMKNKK